MKEVEVFYPNDDDPRKEISKPFAKVDALLEAKTRLGDDIPTFRTLAEDMGIEDLSVLSSNPDFQKGLERVSTFLDGMQGDNDPWNNRVDVSLVRLLLSDFIKPHSNEEKDEAPKEPSVFDQINSYLKKEAPADIENPTVQGIAERMGIAEETLNHWLATDDQFKDELTRLKEFQEKDPFKEGTDFDYFVHSSGVQFVLEETKKRYEGR